MDQQDDRGRSTDSEQLQPQQQQQQRGQQTHEQDGAAVSHGNSGEPSGDLEQGQSSAGESGLEQRDTMIQADRASQSSTVAQRSGGQTEGGKGMGDESFEGSSLGGQSGSSDPARAMFNGEQPGDGQRDPAQPSALDGE